MRWRALAQVWVVVAIGCAGDDAGLDPSAFPYDRLTDYGFFEGELGAMLPAVDVIPYSVVAPLWADAAEKGRFMWLPPGAQIGFAERDEWEFPAGTVFIKSFFFDRDRSAAREDLQVVETRLLVRNNEEWDSYIYLWNEGQDEADLIVAGADVDLEYLDAAGQPQTQLYLVPDQNTCESCHQRDDASVILGPTTSQLNRTWPIEGREVNQIDWLAARGLFAGSVAASAELPALADPAGTADLDARARSYLHGNCAHCHRPGGDGGASGLSFRYAEDDPAAYGVCKVPSAAGAGAGGRRVDIRPGSPEESIVVYRMRSVDPEIKMPELPSLLSDEFGVGLIESWIEQMPADDCGGG